MLEKKTQALRVVDCRHVGRFAKVLVRPRCRLMRLRLAPKQSRADEGANGVADEGADDVADEGVAEVSATAPTESPTTTPTKALAESPTKAPTIVSYRRRRRRSCWRRHREVADGGADEVADKSAQQRCTRDTPSC